MTKTRVGTATGLALSAHNVQRSFLLRAVPSQAGELSRGEPPSALLYGEAFGSRVSTEIKPQWN
jgi:hypothetical protein